MDLAVFVNGDHPHDGYSPAIPGKQHRTGAYPIRIPRVGKDRPSEAVVVLGVQIRLKVYLVVHVSFHVRGRLS